MESIPEPKLVCVFGFCSEGRKSLARKLSEVFASKYMSCGMSGCGQKTAILSDDA